MADDKQSQRPTCERIVSQLEPGAITDEGGRRMLSFTAASSRPLWVGWIGDEYMRVLNMDGMDLSWIQQGTAPFLIQHDMSKPIGQVQGGRIEMEGADKVLRMDVELFEEGVNDEADKYWRMIKSGKMRNISLGMVPKVDGIRMDSIEVNVDGEMKNVDLQVVESCMPDEVSIVSIPADKSVGIGHSVDDRIVQDVQKVVRFNKLNADLSVSSSLEETMSDQPTPVEDEQNASPQEPEAAVAEPEETPEVKQKAQPSIKQQKQEAPQYDPSGQRFLADNEVRLRQSFGLDEKAIGALRQFADANDSNGKAQGRSAEAVQAHIAQTLMGTVDNQDAEGPGKMKQSAPAIHTEDHQVDLGKVAKQLLQGQGHNLKGLEAEQIQESMQQMQSKGVQMPTGYEMNKPNSVFIPHSLIMQDAHGRKSMLKAADKNPGLRQETNRINQRVEVGTPGSSGSPSWFNEVFDETWFVEALVSEAKLLMEISVMPGELYQDLVGVQETGSSTIRHITEDGSRTDSDGVSWGNRKVTWHCVSAQQTFSDRSLDQSRYFFPRLLEVLRRDLTRAQNQALINGAAAMQQPTGVLNFSGLNVNSASGVNGDAPTYAKLTQMRREFYEANADTVGSGMNCWVMTPGVIEALFSTPRLTGQGSTGGASDSIIRGMPDGMMSIDGEKLISENNLPTNGTKGSGTNLHSILYGNFKEVEMGLFSGMQMLTDPYSAARTSQTSVYIRQAYDFSPRHVASFVAATELDAS